MKKIVLQLTLLFMLVASLSPHAENMPPEQRGENAHGSTSPMLMGFKLRDVAPVENTLYRETCGNCHFAYQPGLLPARSWKKIMADLQSHHDKKINLKTQDQEAISRYLLANAADKSTYNRSRRIAKSLQKNDIPTQITKMDYFIKKHLGVSEQLKSEKAEALSFSNCEKCHSEADKGSYNKKGIR